MILVDFDKTTITHETRQNMFDTRSTNQYVRMDNTENSGTDFDPEAMESSTKTSSSRDDGFRRSVIERQLNTLEKLFGDTDSESSEGDSFHNDDYTQPIQFDVSQRHQEARDNLKQLMWQGIVKDNHERGVGGDETEPKAAATATETTAKEIVPATIVQSRSVIVGGRNAIRRSKSNDLKGMTASSVTSSSDHSSTRATRGGSGSGGRRLSPRRFGSHQFRSRSPQPRGSSVQPRRHRSHEYKKRSSPPMPFQHLRPAAEPVAAGGSGSSGDHGGSTSRKTRARSNSFGERLNLGGPPSLSTSSEHSTCSRASTSRVHKIRCRNLSATRGSLSASSEHNCRTTTKTGATRKSLSPTRNSCRSSSSSDQASHCLSIVNDVRIRQGLNPFVADSLLSLEAQKVALIMAESGSTATGTTIGYPGHMLRGSPGVEAIHEKVMMPAATASTNTDPTTPPAKPSKSPAGRNLFSPDFHWIGIGIATNRSGVTFICELFREPHILTLEDVE